MPKFYITKYALTTGIMLVKAEEPKKDMLGWKPAGSFLQYFHGEGLEWHRTEEAALKRAQELRDRKLAQIEKQQKKLKGLQFVIKDKTDA